MMATKWEYDTVLARAKQQILVDVAAGLVPPSCASFSELHDYMDANYYNDAFEADSPSCSAILEDGHAVEVAETDPRWNGPGVWNEIQDALDQWIKAGALRPPSEAEEA